VTMIRWELYKLVRQRRTLFGLGAMALVPILFVAALEITQDGPPEGEAPFATQLLDNGLAVPLVTLAFATFVLLPLVVAFVAGDAVAGEVAGRTLKTVLSRSVGRTELFFSKAAAVGVYCLAAPAVLAGVGLLAGYLAGGFAPLAGLGGEPISVGRGIALVWGGAGLVSVPLMALAAFAIFLSATTHNSLGSGVGAVVLVLLLRLASGLGLAGPLDPYLLTNQFEAWLNLTRDPIAWEPIARSLWVSLLWGGLFLAGAWAVFARRDVLS
jgi:ABC-2 type transport system permease protein